MQSIFHRAPLVPRSARACDLRRQWSRLRPHPSAAAPAPVAGAPPARVTASVAVSRQTVRRAGVSQEHRIRGGLSGRCRVTAGLGRAAAVL